MVFFDALTRVVFVDNSTHIHIFVTRMSFNFDARISQWKRWVLSKAKSRFEC